MHLAAPLGVARNIKRCQRRISGPLAPAPCRFSRRARVADEVTEVLPHPVGGLVEGRCGEERHREESCGSSRSITTLLGNPCAEAWRLVATPLRTK